MQQHSDLRTYVCHCDSACVLFGP